MKLIRNRFVLFALSVFLVSISKAQISGTVFRDFNFNGIKENSGTYNEPFVPGITVKAYDNMGTLVGTQSTNSSGAYSFTGLTLPVRIEFTEMLNDDFTSPYGASNLSSVQFYTSPSSSANFGINYPQHYTSSTNPYYVVSQFEANRPPSNEPLATAMLKQQYNTRGSSNYAPSIAHASAIGATWSVVYDRKRSLIYTSTFAKRHSSMKDNDSDGKEDLGAIYSMTPSGSPSLWLDLSSLGIDFGTALLPSVTARALPTTLIGPSHDAAMFALVGKIGIGGITLSDDYTKMYVMNLYDKKIYTIDVASKTLLAVSSVIPNSCSSGESRPFALKYHRGKVYIGAICDASTSGNFNDLTATIFTYNGISFTNIFSYPLNYVKGYVFKDIDDNNFNSQQEEWGKQWNAWSDVMPSPLFTSNLTSPASQVVLNPQPMLVDLEFDYDESLIMVFNDRFGHQAGQVNYGTNVNNTTSFYTGLAAGDILRASFSSGTYILENDGLVGGLSGNTTNLNGPGGGEFYHGDHDIYNYHAENVIGGSLIYPGKGEVAAIVTDPIGYWAGGVYYFDNVNGNVLNGTDNYQLYPSTLDNSKFGKVNGLGDLELITDAASIEIGNRVWFDSDGDGIQDAGETGIAGVIVELYQGGTLVGTTTTDAAGNYYFNNSNVNLNGASGILPSTAYCVRVPNVIGGSKQGALGSNTLSLANSDASSNGDERDNDGSLNGNNADVCFTTGISGANNHSYDFGFKQCFVDAGNTIYLNCTTPSGTIGTPVVSGDTYSWSPATGLNDATLAQPTASPMTTTTYTLTVNGSCSDTVTVFADKIAPTADAGSTQNLDCATTSATIGTTAIAGNTYSWSPAAGLSATNIAQPTASPTTTTIYTVTVTGSNGCTATSTVTVNVNTTTPTADAGSTQNLDCTTTSATIGTSAIGGNTYSWSPATGLSSTTIAQPTASPSSTTVYTVTVTGSNGCTATSTVTVNVNTTTPTADAGSTQNLDCATTSATIGTSAIGGNTYSWSPATGLSSTTIAQPTASPSSTMVYTVAVTGSNGCTATSTVTVNVNTTAPTADAGSTQNLDCTTTSATIGTTAIAGNTYSWSPAAGLSATNIAQPTANPTSTTTYTVTVTGSNGCTATSTVMVNVNTTAPTVTISGGTIVCNGSTTTLTASGANTYMWSNLDNTAQSVVGVGTYTVTGTASNGCTSTSSVSVINQQGIVGNYVWLDTNRNGLNDEPSSAGINGVTVELWNATTNTLISTTMTANDGSGNPGYYNFAICSNGDYKVKFPLLNGTNTLTSQTSTAGTDNNSDANTVDGFSPTFTIDVTGSGVAKDNTTIDAGYKMPFACLGNYVWNDENQDGLQNNGEVGVSGVTTTLYNATTNVILATVTTDAYGFYQFCGLNPGDYKVGFSLPTNYVFTGSNTGGDDTIDSDPSNITGLTATITLASGDSNMTVDAGIYQPQPTTATVGDRVWFDVNNNGTQDPGEQGVSGVTVTLYNCANPTIPIATTITGANGNYIFENVAAGSYAVSFTAPIGTTFTSQTGSVSTTNNSDADATGKTACFPVLAGDQITYVDAGIIPQTVGNASIGDKVWNDANQDGIQDPTETGVAGVTVTLYDASGTTVISTTTTDGLGNYGFNDLAPGCYVVGFGLPVGYTRTLQGAGSDTTKNSDANTTTGLTSQVCVSAGQNNSTIDAGIYNASNTNSLGDKVWYDVDKDGIQDVGEYGYPGVVVTLYDCTTNTIQAITTTDANGNYLFDGIANGSYYVGFGFIPGFQFTGANADVAGILGGNNSDANPSSGLTACVSLTGNTNITTVDAGIYPGNTRNATSSLGDIVWLDANSNGLQDNGETGVPGVTATLINATTNAVLATTITDGLGNYIFTNLDGGNYKVEFSNIPVGYTFTTQGSNIEDEDNSDANPATGMTNSIPLGVGEDKMSVDAGIVAPLGTVCLGDYVWIDLDNDGVQEANEPAVPGVTVKLYDNNTNTVLQVATTNREGQYLFCGLTTGNTYSVGFENLPAGFTFTTSSGALSTPDNSDANPVTGRTTTVTLGATNDLTLDAGIYSPTTAVVGNYVWYDEDADGIQDPTEAPIPGVLVTLYDNTNTPVASAVTDANGGYLFTNVAPGTYTIGFEGYPSTLIPTTKGANPSADDDSNIDPITGRTDAFIVTPGSSNLTLDAGYKANPIAGLGNYVWYDINENGLQDASEPGISGVIVSLFESDGSTLIATAITDGNGAYSFPNLPAGSYVVGFTAPAGYTRTKSLGGLNDALNSDVDVTNKTAVVTLIAGEYNPNIDAGFYIGVPLPAKVLQATLANFVNASLCTVNWFTKDEQNTLSFEIERGVDKQHFEKVGIHIAAGNSFGQTDYSFNDDLSSLSEFTTLYYRIKLVDIDGKISYSNVINVTKPVNDEPILVYPNPFVDALTIELMSDVSDLMQLTLSDLNGRVISVLQKEVAEGMNKITIQNLGSLSSGNYYLKITSLENGYSYLRQLSK